MNKYMVEVEDHFSYAHRLRGPEAGKCGRLHGHNARVVVRLEADGLDANGMVVDFRKLKKVVGKVVDEFDHRTLLRQDDELAEVIPGRKILSGNPTAEVLATAIRMLIRSSMLYTEFPYESRLSVTVYETATCSATAS